MANKQTPFWDLDVTKLISEFKIPGVDVEQVLATQRKNIEALTAANKVAFEGFQAVAQRQTEILRQTMEEISGLVQGVISAPTPEEKVAKQAELTKHAFEKALSNAKELAELITRSNNEAADLINKRVSATLEELKATAVKK